MPFRGVLVTSVVFYSLTPLRPDTGSLMGAAVRSKRQNTPTARSLARKTPAPPVCVRSPRKAADDPVDPGFHRTERTSGSAERSRPTDEIHGPCPATRRLLPFRRRTRPATAGPQVHAGRTESERHSGVAEVDDLQARLHHNDPLARLDHRRGEDVQRKVPKIHRRPPRREVRSPHLPRSRRGPQRPGNLWVEPLPPGRKTDTGPNNPKYTAESKRHPAICFG